MIGSYLDVIGIQFNGLACINNGKAIVFQLDVGLFLAHRSIVPSYRSREHLPARRSSPDFEGEGIGRT